MGQTPHCCLPQLITDGWVEGLKEPPPWLLQSTVLSSEASELTIPCGPLPGAVRQVVAAGRQQDDPPQPTMGDGQLRVVPLPVEWIAEHDHAGLHEVTEE
eukprot:5180327-Lingulodinium_polyedra.AAC.1